MLVVVKRQKLTPQSLAYPIGYRGDRCHSTVPNNTGYCDDVHLRAKTWGILQFVARANTCAVTGGARVLSLARLSYVASFKMLVTTELRVHVETAYSSRYRAAYGHPIRHRDQRFRKPSTKPRALCVARPHSYRSPISRQLSPNTQTNVGT